MKFVFRVDSSTQTGIGHVMRCLTLAEQLRCKGAECSFISRDLTGNLNSHISRSGFLVNSLIGDCGGVEDVSSSLPWSNFEWQVDAHQTSEILIGSPPDWLVVDHYAIDEKWESAVSTHCRKLMVIDDLANRPHQCDLLLDQNYYRDSEKRYAGLLPPHCVTFLGPQFVLLRNEFLIAKGKLKNRDGIVRRVMIFFGGTDPLDQTIMAINALNDVRDPKLHVDVIVGATNEKRSTIQELCASIPHFNFHINVSNMAELILQADLCIGAGGSAMWERCYLGLPTVTVVCADNQLRTTLDVASIGAIEFLGRAEELDLEAYKIAIRQALNSRSRLQRISSAALNIFYADSSKSVINELYQLSGQRPTG